MTKLSREKHLFTRQEFLDLFGEHFRIVPRKWDRENTEEFSIYDTDVDYMSLRYSLNSVKENFKESRILEIFIITWAGDWDHQKSFIKLEWHYSNNGYDISWRLKNSDTEKSNKLEKQTKDDALRELLNFFHFIEPDKTIPLERDIKIKEILK